MRNFFLDDRFVGLGGFLRSKVPFLHSCLMRVLGAASCFDRKAVFAELIDPGPVFGYIPLLEFDPTYPFSGV